MKKEFVVFILFLLCSFSCISQSKEPAVGSSIPAFRLRLTNGKDYANKDLPKDRPLVLIYFAPDCEHCIKLMDELFKKIHQLDKAKILMVTFEMPKEVAWFERKYQTAQYANITVGTEGTTYVLRNYYRLDKTPFTAVYNKKGKLSYSYKNETPVSEMLARFKKL